MTARPFHLGDVLSVTTGLLVSPRHMNGVYDILNFMTGDNLYTHQLPRASRECKPHLLQQHPCLATISSDGIGPDNWEPWLKGLIAIHGEQLLVAPLPLDAHERIDPLSELVEKVHPDRIVVVQTPATGDNNA